MDRHLSEFSYIMGHTPTTADHRACMKLNAYADSLKVKNSVDKFPHFVRWHNHISSFEKKDIDMFLQSDLNILDKFGISSISAKVKDTIFLLKQVLHLKIVTCLCMVKVFFVIALLNEFITVNKLYFTLKLF